MRRKDLNLNSDTKEQIIDNPVEYIKTISQRSMSKSNKKRPPKRDRQLERLGDMSPSNAYKQY